MRVRKIFCNVRSLTLGMPILVLAAFSPQESRAAEDQDQNWGYTIADGVSEYFLRMYEDLALIYTAQGKAVGGFFRPVKSEWVPPEKEKIERIIGDQKCIVPRPQHGIAHGLRQGFLAVDIINILNSIDLDTLEADGNLPDSALQAIKVVQNIMKSNPEEFLRNIQAAASFIKSGRVDEINAGPEYTRAVQRDATNFYKFALQHEDVIHPAARRFFALVLSQGWGPSPNKELFKLDPILEKQFTPDKIQNNVWVIGKIMVAAHKFDLGRLPTPEYILPNKKEACAYMFDSVEKFKNVSYPNYPPLMQNICDNLWERGREYLIATGDKHYNDDGRLVKDQNNKFFLQADNPPAIIDALEEARANSKIKNFFTPLQNKKWFNPSE